MNLIKNSRAASNRTECVDSEKGHSSSKESVPIQECASDFRLFLYVRETMYSLPPVMRNTYSPVAPAWISSTQAALTRTDR
jgi:hypothetical protein